MHLVFLNILPNEIALNRTPWSPQNHNNNIKGTNNLFFFKRALTLLEQSHCARNWVIITSRAVEVDAKATVPLEVVGVDSCSLTLLSLPLDAGVDVSHLLGFSVGGSGCVSDCSVTMADVVGMVDDVCGFTVGSGGGAFVPKINVNIDLSFKVALYSVKFAVSFPVKMIASLSFNTWRHVASSVQGALFFLNSNFGFAKTFPILIVILKSWAYKVGNV